MTQEEYERLKEIEKKYLQLQLEDSTEVAKKMTSNAMNVNKASKERIDGSSHNIHLGEDLLSKLSIA